MAASVARGITFTPGEQNITAAVFTTLLTSAVITNIDRDNVKMTSATPSTFQAGPPDGPQASEVWQDSTTNFPKSYVSGAWAPCYYPAATFTLSAVTGSAVVPGDVLMVSQAAGDAGTTRYTKCTAALRYAAFAVSLDSVALGGVGRLVFDGPVRVRTNGSAINAGEGVLVSTTDGTVVSAGAAGSGSLSSCIGTAIEAASGGYVWIHLRR